MSKLRNCSAFFTFTNSRLVGTYALCLAKSERLPICSHVPYSTVLTVDRHSVIACDNVAFYVMEVA